MRRHRLTLALVTLSAVVVTVTPVPFMAGCASSDEGTPVATASAAEETSRATGFDTPPRPVKQVPPEYPESAKASGTEGKVWVRLTIDANGAVEDAVVERRSDESVRVFDDAALEAARAWTFEPATAGDEPVKSRIVVPFAFALR